ncbi:MAG: hypothetical protein KGZ63_05510 [Clostridiales bacterium]|jgi:hypothetical protein|nr:hypothetical protein [Clostridiales bacterium]
MKINIKPKLVALILLCGASLLLINITTSFTNNPNFMNNTENKPYSKQESYISASWAYSYLDFETMKLDSTVVAIGTIEKAVGTNYIQPAESNPKVNVQIPKTEYLFNIQRVLHGDAPQNIIISQIGGISTNGKILAMEDDPLYQVGEQYLLYLKKAPDKEIYFTPSPQARFVTENMHVFTIRKNSPNIKVSVFDVDGLPLETFLKEAGLE